MAVPKVTPEQPPFCSRWVGRSGLCWRYSDRTVKETWDDA